MIDLTLPGAYARAGGGNQEIPQFQKQAVSWIAWSINPDNGGGGGTAVWEKAIGLWNAAGILNFPWLHCRSMADVQRLVSVAKANDAPALGLNIEDIVGDKLSLQEIAEYLQLTWPKPVHMPTLDWVQNGQGWQHLSFVTAALEIFPGEGSLKNGYNAAIVEQCIEHALAEGLTKVTLMFKTKGLSPATYGQQWSICHSLYTSDDIAPTQPAWAAWESDGTCTTPTPPSPPPWDPRRLWAVPCAVGPRAAHDSGTRKASAIDLVVIHTAEAADLVGPDNTAQGVANFFAREDVEASTQLAVDRDNCVRMLPDLVVPWGAKGANHDGLHMEICGRASWTEERWRSAEVKPMLARAAAKTAKWCWQYDIPRRWLTIADLKNDERGLTTHVDVEKVWPLHGHTDPGTGFPRDYFLGKVNYWYEQIRLERESS